jgi:hypothetical protein
MITKKKSEQVSSRGRVSSLYLGGAWFEYWPGNPFSDWGFQRLSSVRQDKFWDFFFFGATVPIWALAYLHETLRFTSVF